MTAAFVAGVVAGYAVALPVGAVGTYLVSLGARQPLRTSVAAALGVATTDGIFALLAALSGVGLERLIRPLSKPLTALAALVLVAFAVRTLTVAVRHRGRAPFVGGETRPLHAFLGLLALTAVNPATIVYFIALVLGGQTDLHSVAAGAVFALGVFVASASWQVVLAGSGAAVGRVLTGTRGQFLIAAISGVIMLALAVQLLARLR